MSDLRRTSVGPAQTVWIFNPSSGEEEEGNETPGPELTAFVTGVPLLFSTSCNFSRVCVCVCGCACVFGGSFESLFRCLCWCFREKARRQLVQQPRLLNVKFRCIDLLT